MYKRDPIVSSSPPLRATAIAEDSDDEQIGEFVTQPTQQLPPERSHFFTGTQPTMLLTPQSSRAAAYPSQVQVSRSSPAIEQTPPPMARNLMAPPGTYSQLPPAVPRRAPVDLTSDDPPVEPDSEEEGFRGSNIPPSKVETQRSHHFSSPRVEETPQKPLFDLSSFKYNARKRPSNRSASPPAKRPKQTGPSRAMPVDLTQSDDEQPDISTLNDIKDMIVRDKVWRLGVVHNNKSVKQRYNALMKARGNTDDANNYLLDSSEDELSRPNSQAAPPKKTAQRVLNQRLTSLADRYSNKQAPPTPKVDPSPEKPKKKGRLVRGRRNRTPTPESSPEKLKSKSFLDDDEEEEAILIQSDSGSEAGSDDVEEVFDDRNLLSFFNKCTVKEMVDLSGHKEEDIASIFEQRPFRSLAAIEKIHVDHRQLETGKKARKPKSTVGERLVESARNMWKAYETIDSVVKQCEARGRPIVTAMARWGVDMFGGSTEGEVAVTELIEDSDAGDSGYHSSRSNRDSDSDHDSLRKSLKRTKLIKKPSIMNKDIELKDYQVVGLNWLNLLWNNEISGILADDMGLGKTCQVISLISHLKQTSQEGPHLIVVPGSTLENWAREFRHFSETINFEIYYGSQNDRMYKQDEILDQVKSKFVDVVLTTYDLAFKPMDNKFLRKLNPKMCIFDEGHMLKNSTTQRYLSLMKIPSRCRLLLTGTPLQNSLQELLSILAFLMPDIFNTEEVREGVAVAFKHKAKVTESDSHDTLLSTQRINRARSMMTPFVLRRKKAQVLKHLPKKTCRVEYCELTPIQKKIYDEQLKKLERVAGQPTKEHTNVIMKLRQAAIHPLLFRERYNDTKIAKMSKACLKEEMFRESNPDIIFEELQLYQDYQCHSLALKYPALSRFELKNHEWMDSGKVIKLVELLRRFKNDRTLIFSQFTSVMDILQWVLDEEDIAYSRIDGSTAISDRQPLLDQFYEDESIPVFMLSTKSGGAGINLACANKVIIFDSSFNPQDDIQAENRAHRVGQTREVEVVRLVTKGTVEEQIHALGISKLELDKMVAGEEAEGSTAGKKGAKKAGDDAAGFSAAEAKGMEAVEEMILQSLKKKDDGKGKGSGADKDEDKNVGKKDVNVKKKGGAVKKEKGASVKKGKDVKDQYLDRLVEAGLDMSAA
ncbi:hypothetical protein DM02DRAFT_225525 [Periconia macrospinosa]|uniref:DNA helicase n=1 Tax=Periconia macrospinosa TaxID=97972 RepID=A0A2V1E241_9PLEO|nr:hypothetical protein DM02DRAFT_225525 [Periconia macrospinosa]